MTGDPKTEAEIPMVEEGEEESCVADGPASDSDESAPESSAEDQSSTAKKQQKKERPAPGTAQDRALAQVAAVAAVALFGIMAYAAAEPWFWLKQLHAVRGTGWAAVVALLLSLLMTPMSRLWGMLGAQPRPAVWVAYRRAFGVVSAVLAWVHLGLSLGTYLRDSWPSVLHWPYLRSGLVAACVLTALFITSFPSILAMLRLKGWKELHRLAYVAAILVLHHLLLSPFAPRQWVLVVFGLCLLPAPLRALKARRKRAGDRQGSPAL